MSKSILETVHESVRGLYEIGLVDATTMRKFDAQCLEPAKKMSKAEIKKIRLKVKVSQPVFAEYLNVSPTTVKKWESGEKHPNGASLRLLQLVKHDGLDVFKNIQAQ
jgi:putative transcriptional regulator